MTTSTTTTADVTLAVLAGGAGRRMGSPKGNLRVGGMPILLHLLRRLAWPGPTLLVTAPGREHPEGWEAFTAEVTDPTPDLGPLRGVLTALEHAATPEVVVVPVDMPNLTVDVLHYLLVELRRVPTAAVAVIERGRGDEHRLEPLPIACRPTSAAAIARQLLDTGTRALHALAKGGVAVRCPAGWHDSLWTNLNRPADLAAYGAPEDRTP